jgi:HlyD family secretion protein
MDDELKSLRIDRNQRRKGGESKWARRWIIGGVLLFLLLGLSRFAYERVNAATEVEVQRVRSTSASAAPQGVVLNATGYIVAAHKIELASKVMGKVAWIGVEKGDRVTQGQELVKLEDDEYRAQLAQARGALANLEAKLAEATNGSRPEEIAQAEANVASARADLENARVTIERTRRLANEGVLAKQNLDDAQAKYDSAQARLNSLQKSFELVKLGPRQEQIDAFRGQVDQARGAVAFAQTNLDNTIIRAPVTGTVLERNVEKGEFVTTGFVGDKGAKGYVVSMADLHDLEVELDISQNDFAKLAGGSTAAGPSVIVVPPTAVRDNSVFVLLGGKAVQRRVKTGTTSSLGVRVESGLIGGEDLIVNPPAGLKDGDRVRRKS